MDYNEFKMILNATTNTKFAFNFFTFDQHINTYPTNAKPINNTLCLATLYRYTISLYTKFI